MTSLHLAITEHNDSQIEWLLEHGEEEQILRLDQEGNTPLMLAVSRHIYDWHLQKLLERGADLQARNNQGRTALMQALDFNNRDAVRTLLAWYQQKGVPAHVEASLEQGRLALFFAAYNDDVSAAEALLQAGAEVDGRNQWARTPLMLAAEAGREGVMRLLLERGAGIECVEREGDTALALAAGASHAGSVRLLLEYGADPNSRAENGWTPLLHSACCGDGSEAARHLLEHGADVHACSTDGSSALSLAAWLGNEEMVRVLLEAGAGEDQQSLQAAFRSAYLDNGTNTVPLLRQAGATPGFLEAIAAQDFQQVSHWILVEKADVNARSEGGTTPLLAAVYDGSGTNIYLYAEKTGLRIIRLLLEHGAEVNAVSRKGSTALLTAIYFRAAEIAMLLMEHGAAVHTLGRMFDDFEEETPLTMAPFAENLEALREMVRRGADVDTPNSRGQTALMRAAQFGNRDTVALLVEHGADVHLRDPQGRTALMYAALGGDCEIMDVLLSHGAQANVSDTAGITALQLAQGWVGKGIVERLLEAGATA